VKFGWVIMILDNILLADALGELSARRQGKAESIGEKLRRGTEIFLRMFDKFTGIPEWLSLDRRSSVFVGDSISWYKTI
jgi:hypothetical protein